MSIGLTPKYSTIQLKQKKKLLNFLTIFQKFLTGLDEDDNNHKTKGTPLAVAAVAARIGLFQPELAMAIADCGELHEILDVVNEPQKASNVLVLVLNNLR